MSAREGAITTAFRIAQRAVRQAAPRRTSDRPVDALHAPDSPPVERRPGRCSIARPWRSAPARVAPQAVALGSGMRPHHQHAFGTQVTVGAINDWRMRSATSRWPTMSIAEAGGTRKGMAAECQQVLVIE